MELTEHLKLKKPGSTDYVHVSDLNDNADVLDKEFGELKKGSTTIEDLQTENKTLAGAINELERNKADKTYVAEQVENIDVPVKSVNTKTGAVTLSASDVGAVPVGRKVNNKVLSADITLVASDVGASPVGHLHAYSTLTGIPGTFPPSAHAHASSQVGLGNVQNYGIATTAEAQAGAVNNKYMTPALTKSAIKHIATTGGISMVKSVQRGVLSLGFGEKVINISRIDNKKSMVLLDGNSTFQDDSDRADSRVPYVKNLTDTLLTVAGEGYEALLAQTISWQVIEYY